MCKMRYYATGFLVSIPNYSVKKVFQLYFRYILIGGDDDDDYFFFVYFFIRCAPIGNTFFGRFGDIHAVQLRKENKDSISKPMQNTPCQM